MTAATTIRRGWLHETHPGISYRWVVPNEVMRSDEYGVELTCRPSEPGDVICGARTIEPGIPGVTDYRGMDLSVPHEVVCAFVGDHGEAPHIGVHIECSCENPVAPSVCPETGGHHLVYVGFAIRPGRPSVAPGVTADQDVWGPNESEEP